MILKSLFYFKGDLGELGELAEIAVHDREKAHPNLGELWVSWVSCI